MDMNYLQSMTCYDKERQLRKEKELPLDALQNKMIYINGFKVLIVMDRLLSGDYNFKGTDGCKAIRSPYTETISK
jgi:hypothetical protein